MIALLWTARPVDEGTDRLDHARRGVLDQRRVVAAGDHDPLPIGRAETREQPRLRKRFQLAKEKLRELAERDGLLPIE